MNLTSFEQMIERLPFSGCWIWMGHVQLKGYGHIGVWNGKATIPMTAHRWAWQKLRGPIQNGLLVCHKCDVRSCVNPDHLFLGTAKENTMDMMRKRRHKPARLQGEKNPASKLTRAQADEIRALKGTGTEKEVASRYGVSSVTVGGIWRGKTWR